MTVSITSPDSSTARPSIAVGAAGARIRFVTRVAPEDRILSRFSDPREVLAVEQIMPLSDFPAERPGLQGFNELDVLTSSATRPSDLETMVDQWLVFCDHSEMPPPIGIELEGVSIRWRAGRAVVAGDGERCREVLAGLVDFAFYEGELRRLEQDLLPYEVRAPDDIALAYQVRGRFKSQWERLTRTMEELSRLRLTFARLEPRLGRPPRSLPPQTRGLFVRLVSRSDVPARLEAFNDRLEACEDLYEGAVDRIADFRWYRRSEWLEFAILVLLGLEVIATVSGIRLH